MREMELVWEAWEPVDGECAIPLRFLAARPAEERGTKPVPVSFWAWSSVGWDVSVSD